MNNIWEAIERSFLKLNTPIGLIASSITILDHFRNQNKNHMEETLHTIREKSEKAYEEYCEYRKYRQDNLGVPVKEAILGYWDTCLQRNILPCVDDMVSSKIADRNEAEIIMPCLMEKWMTVSAFSTWMNDILNQNHLEELSEQLTAFTAVLEAIPQIKTQLENQKLHNMATLITPVYINDAKYSCRDSDVKNFFTVDNNFFTMLRVISADNDVPHEKAVQKVMQIIGNGCPAIITGNGGHGKTSLMLRTAVQWVSSGNVAVWMSLSNKEIITETMADQFFDCLIRAIPEKHSVLLCIDNPFEGSESLSSLQARWPQNAKICLIMAERENRLTLLADPNRNLLFHWFDDAELIVLQSIKRTRLYHLKSYKPHYFPESRNRQKAILETCTSYLVKEGIISEADQLLITDKMLSQYGKPNVSLVELIYRTLFELKKIASKPESIKLDWEEWGELINREFQNVDSNIQLYGVIAVLKIFNTPLTLSLFCKFFDLDKRKLRNRLRERFIQHHVEPVVFQEDSQTLQPKHDVIAELFFLFNEKKVTINSIMLDLLAVMDEDETEAFLSNLKNKSEIRKGKKAPFDKIDYWSYIVKIYARAQRGELNLSHSGRAYLCLGALWARDQRKLLESGPSVRTILDNFAPEIDCELLLAKVYTEWGIWLKDEKKNDLAERKLLDVIKYNPSELPARTELGRLLSKQPGRENEAEKFLWEVIKIDPKNIQSRTELGRLLSRQKGREDEAEKILREAIRINPKHIQSRTELGRLLAKQKGRKGEAERLFLEVIKIHPKDIQSRAELGRLLSRQKGRENEAEKFLQEAIRIDPKNLHPHTILAQLYEHLDRLPEARQLYQELCEIAPENRFGKKGLARLSDLPNVKNRNP